MRIIILSFVEGSPHISSYALLMWLIILLSHRFNTAFVFFFFYDAMNLKLNYLNTTINEWRQYMCLYMYMYMQWLKVKLMNVIRSNMEVLLLSINSFKTNYKVDYICLLEGTLYPLVSYNSKYCEYIEWIFFFSKGNFGIFSKVQGFILFSGILFIIFFFFAIPL